jgi:hypothetical protein
MKLNKLIAVASAVTIIGSTLQVSVPQATALSDSTPAYSDRLSSGNGHGCALNTIGELYCWGWNAEGATGRGTFTEAFEEVSKVSKAIVDGEEVAMPLAKKVVSNVGGSCALTFSEELYCWGNYFQVDGSKMPTPSKVVELENVIDVSLESNSVCAIHGPDLVSCWGFESSGTSFGEGFYLEPKPLLPTQVEGFVGARKIASSLYATCILDNEDHVVCLGLFRSAGQTSTLYPTPTRIPEFDGSKEIEMGMDHICSVFSAGNVLCWGKNTSGSLGTGNKERVTEAVSPIGLPSVIGISIRYSQTCAWTASGELWCWGNGKLATSDTPVLAKTMPLMAYPGISPYGLCSIEYSGKFNCEPYDSVPTPDLSPLVSKAINFTSPTTSTIVFTWMEPLAAGNVDGYSIDYSVKGSGAWVSASQQSISNKTVTLSSLRPATTYQIRISPTVDGDKAPASIFEGYTSGVGSLPIQVFDHLGFPVSGGIYSWVSKDGKSRSSRASSATSLGSVTFNSVPGKPIELKIKDAITQDGIKISGTFNVSPINSTLRLSLPEYEKPKRFEALVAMPNLQPVAGAKVESKGLSASATVVSSDFKGTATLINALVVSTGSDGRGSIRGFPIDKVEIRAVYDDGELDQSTDWSTPSVDEVSELQLEYMPVVQASKSEVLTSQNSLVSIDVFYAEPGASGAFATRSSMRATLLASKASAAGSLIEVIPPPGSSQTKCKGKVTLKAKTTSKGKAKLVFCANSSGTYALRSKGAVSSDGVFVKVKNSRPTPPQSLTVLPKDNSVTVAWQDPRYSGGKPITNYKILATAQGQVPRVWSFNTKANAFKQRTAYLDGLDGKQTWAINIFASNAFGESDAVSTSALVSGDIFKTLTDLPEIKVLGRAASGSTLKSSPLKLSSGFSVTYQWFKNGSEISGATGNSYKVKSSDKKASLKLRVTVSKQDFRTVELTSNSVKVG